MKLGKKNDLVFPEKSWSDNALHPSKDNVLQHLQLHESVQTESTRILHAASPLGGGNDDLKSASSWRSQLRNPMQHLVKQSSQPCIDFLLRVVAFHVRTMLTEL